jgi:NAD(P)H-nitrite reductase large subunit
MDASPLRLGTHEKTERRVAMTKKHLIIGGGPAATNAIETIREFDNGGSEITLVADEPAHSRMALPYWLSGQVSEEHTHTGDAAYFEKLGVTTKLGHRAQQLDVGNRTVALADGTQLAFDDLLIATGSSPLVPPIPGTDLPGVQPLWTLAHTRSVLDVAKGKPLRVVLVGAGFIGFIVLNAMYKRGWKLSVVEREAQILPRMLDAPSAAFVATWLESRHIDVHAGTTVQEIQPGDGDAKRVVLHDGRQLDADVVILATGIKANTELLDGTDVELDQAILVNDQMQTNHDFIYAAGDVAQGAVLFSAEKQVHAIQPTAVDHGRVAGANMAGHEVHYPGSLSMNVTDVCGLQTASYGNWNDPQAEATTIANEAELIYRKLLWRGDQLVGAVFTGRPSDMGMLTDIGMVKGILQTQTSMGVWKKFLTENPFDIRRPYIATGVAQKLAATTLLGRPAKSRGYRHQNADLPKPVGKAHAQFVATRQS